MKFFNNIPLILLVTIYSVLLQWTPSLIAQNCTNVTIIFDAPSPDILFVCQGAVDIDLMQYASTTTGSFSGPGVLPNGTTFDPSALDGGVYNVKYTDGADTCSKTISVIDFKFNNGTGDTSICKVPSGTNPDDFDIYLNQFASPPGGQFSGNGVEERITGFYFSPFESGEGTHIITYTFGSATCTRTFQVSGVGFDLSNQLRFPCASEAAYSLIDQNTSLDPSFGSGAYFVGNGVIEGTSFFDPAEAGAGLHEIFYVDGFDSCSQTISVSPVNFVANLDPGGPVNLCLFSDPLVINGNGTNPIAGSFAVNDVPIVVGNSFTFDPNDYDKGTYFIEYTYLDVAGDDCITKDTIEIKLGDSEARIDLDKTVFCESDEGFFAQVDPQGGTLFAKDTSLKLIGNVGVDVGASEPGDYYLYYEFIEENNPCSGIDSILFTITAGDRILYTVIESVCPNLADVILYTGDEISDSIQLEWSVDNFEIFENQDDTILLVYWDYPGIYDVNLEVSGSDCTSNGENVGYEVNARDESECNISFFIPNIFTPNSDGSNDDFKILGKGMISTSLHVFDRWGEKIFESNEQEVGWDGTFKGEPLSPGVYFYYAEAEFEDGTNTFEKGNVTLVR